MSRSNRRTDECVGVMANRPPDEATGPQLSGGVQTHARAAGSGKGPLLEVRNLKVYFPFQRGHLLHREHGFVRAVDGISFTVQAGETLGLVGESGCGKSTAARAILNLLRSSGTPVKISGEVRWLGERIDGLTDAQMRPFRRQMQMIFQDPFASLNPRMTVGAIIAEPMNIFRLHPARQRKLEVLRLMDLVGLNPRFMNRYPHEFSGGQRQRIGIARALAVNPKLIVCDEPVSALDVSIQAQVINLLVDLQKKLGLAYVFIAHDLSVVRHISDRIGVMYLGRIVELADAVRTVSPAAASLHESITCRRCRFLILRLSGSGGGRCLPVMFLRPTRSMRDAGLLIDARLPSRRVGRLIRGWKARPHEVACIVANRERRLNGRCLVVVAKHRRDCAFLLRYAAGHPGDHAVECRQRHAQADDAGREVIAHENQQRRLGAFWRRPLDGTVSAVLLGGFGAPRIPVGLRLLRAQLRNDILPRQEPCRHTYTANNKRYPPMSEAIRILEVGLAICVFANLI